MCGLVGIAGSLEYKDEKTMQRMLLLDYFRGTDSTGFASVTLSDQHSLVKVASHPLDLFDMTRFKSALNGATSKVFIGHNRAATRGLVSAVNAHPYLIEDGDEFLIGAHNGTLKYADHTMLEDTVNETFGTDSNALFAAISAYGPKEVIPELEEGLTATDGAWALTWYDSEEDAMFFLRNRHRPLWYAFTEDKKKLFWASEWHMIEAAVGMSVNGYKLYADEQGYQYWQFDPNTLYKFPLGSLLKGDWGDPRVEEIKGKEPTLAAPAAGKPDPFGRPTTNACGFHTSPEKKTGSTTNSRGDKSDQRVVNLLGSNDNPFAGVVTESEFRLISYGGCSFCGADIDWGKPGLTVYERDKKVLCPSCSGHMEGSKNVANRVYCEDVRAVLAL